MAADDSGAIHLFDADPRGIMPLAPKEGLHVPASVERVLRSKRFEITSDRDFEGVIRGCAVPRENDGVWISEQLIQAMCAMYEAGFAHSVEAWRTDPASGDPHLVGGIYGVSIGRLFCAESMFCVPRPRLPDGSRHPLDGTDASKACLVTVIRHLHACGYGLLDIQMVTPHTARFGARNIRRAQYKARTRPLVGSPDAWQPLPA
jgi:leucyl/phenylalanyl-tRNA--protein transferase